MPFRVEEVATGLDTPWELAFAPDGRIFVTERPGRLRVIENGRLRAEPVANVPDVAEQGEGGLLGLALAPDFATSGNLYLYHTYRDNGTKNRVVRYALTDRAGARGLGGQQIIIDNIPGAGNHNGGRIAFGPDGKLYVTNGDAASTALAQDRNSLAGKILRLETGRRGPRRQPFPRLAGLLLRPSQPAGTRLAAGHEPALRHRARPERQRRGQSDRRGRQFRLADDHRHPDAARD